MADLTKEEQNARFNSQPTKRIGTSALLFTPDGRLLILKPYHKDGWSVPGGIVNKDESPLMAARRNTKEEIDLDISTDRLILFGVRYVDARDGMNEGVQVMFMTTLTEPETEAIRLKLNEIDKFVFASPDEMQKYLDHPRMQAVFAALDAGHSPVFMHNESVVSAGGFSV